MQISSSMQIKTYWLFTWHKDCSWFMEAILNNKLDKYKFLVKFKFWFKCKDLYMQDLLFTCAKWNYDFSKTYLNIYLEIKGILQFINVHYCLMIWYFALKSNYKTHNIWLSHNLFTLHENYEIPHQFPFLWEVPDGDAVFSSYNITYTVYLYDNVSRILPYIP